MNFNFEILMTKKVIENAPFFIHHWIRHKNVRMIFYLRSEHGTNEVLISFVNSHFSLTLSV